MGWELEGPVRSDEKPPPITDQQGMLTVEEKVREQGGGKEGREASGKTLSKGKPLWGKPSGGKTGQHLMGSVWRWATQPGEKPF